MSRSKKGKRENPVTPNHNPNTNGTSPGANDDGSPKAGGSPERVEQESPPQTPQDKATEITQIDIAALI